MKISLPLKLGILIVALFGVIAAGMFLYQPLRYAWLKSKLASENTTDQKSAIAILSSEPGRSIINLRRWLRSPNQNLVINSCKVLGQESMTNWKEALPELKELLHNDLSSKTYASAGVLGKKGYIWSDHEGWSSSQKRNLLCNDLLFAPDVAAFFRAPDSISELIDQQCLPPLLESLKLKYYHPDRVNKIAEAVILLDNTSAIEPLIDLLNEDEWDWSKSNIIWILGELGDTRATEPLLNFYDHDNSFEGERCAIAEAFGDMAESKGIPILLAMLENDDYGYVREYAAKALGQIGNNSATKEMIRIYRNTSDEDVKGDPASIYSKYFPHAEVASSLGMIGDIRAIPVLINSLDCRGAHDHGIYTIGQVDASAAFALGEIGNTIAVKPLSRILLDNTVFPESPDLYDDDYRLHFIAAVSLMRLDTDEKYAVLEKARQKGNHGAALALVNLRGPKEIEKIGDFSKRSPLYKAVAAKWGDVEALEDIASYFKEYHNREFDMVKFRVILTCCLFSPWPEGIPKYDYKAKASTQMKQARYLYEWFKRNKDRISWDADKRKYYLKDR